MEHTLDLAIEGMHCAACVRRVANALQGIEGVTVRAVDVGSAKITFDAREASAHEIAAALERKGFPGRIQS